jgi:glycosyltransferase involved in cell wall biosynthesis
MKTKLKMEKNSVLIAIERFPPDFTGAGIRASRLANKMHKEYFYSYKILTLKNSQSNPRDETEQKVFRLKIITPKILFPLYLIELIIKTNLFLYKNRKEIDIIHFFSLFWLNRIIMLSNLLFYHKRTVLEITLYGDDDPVNMINKNWLNKLLKPITLNFLKKIDKIIVLNKESRNSCLKSGIPKNKIWFRPNPIDEELFNYVAKKDKKAIRKKLGLPDKFILLSVGIIRKRKDQLFLAEVIRKLREKNILLLLLGPTDRDLPYHKLVLKYIKENSLENQVILLGEKKNVNDFLAASDLFVFASRREGFSNAVGESMMSGLPIVLLEHDNIDKYVNKETGIIISYLNRETALNEFAAAIKRVYSKQNLFSPQKIRELAIKFFSATKIYGQYDSIYNKLRITRPENEK